MEMVCKKDMCAGCMACVVVCKKDAIIIKDDLNTYNAMIDSVKCVNCGACKSVCQNNVLLEPLRKPLSWCQGWANDIKIRKRASSGGIATAVMQGFILGGGIVCSCVFKDGEFIFDFAENVESIEKFMGSKYIKSNPQKAFIIVKNYLKNGRKLLFIGLPCQVSAIKNYVGASLLEKLYTVDLICHGSPSPKIMDIFLKQYSKDVHKQTSFLFRDKGMFQIAVSGEYIVCKGASDRYTTAFLNALTYTENCYSCKYACMERVSDISLGDSWGSELAIDERKKGISLVLIQTGKGRELLKQADLHLEPVNLKKAARANQQLMHPSIKNLKSEKFWHDLKLGTSFNRLVFRYFPKKCIKQDVKRLLLTLRVIHR